jgi:hypothetical protein
MIPVVAFQITSLLFIEIIVSLRGLLIPTSSRAIRMLGFSNYGVNSGNLSLSAAIIFLMDQSRRASSLDGRVSTLKYFNSII